MCGAALLCAGVLLALAPRPALADARGESWPMAGQSILGNRVQPHDSAITPRNVGHLVPKWVFTDHGDVSATPTVADGAVYFPDFGGYLNAVNARTGKLIWQRQISAYDGEAGQVSRNSPLVLGNELVLGDNAGTAQPQGAHLFAVDRRTGRLLWSTQIDSNPAAQVPSNPVALGHRIVVGVSSNEEVDANSPSYHCCTFRGAVVELNAAGHILWKTYTVPSNNGGGDSNAPCATENPATGCGYTGNAVWSTPTIDPRTGQVFVATGNNYTSPDAATACATAAANANPPTSDANCTTPDDHFDSMLALNLRTGKIEWGQKVEGYDAWTVACFAGSAPGVNWCPSPASPDYDFGGSSPNLFTIRGAGGQPETLVGEGQKSGLYWAFDAATGKIVWHTLVGPGALFGGIEWGSAYDGRRIYTAEADTSQQPYTLAGGQPAHGGSWLGLNPQTGTIEWQTATPGSQSAEGPVSEAGGVVYAASTDPSATNPDMFALDAATGRILWSYAAGSSVNASPSIVGDTLYWGSGYTHLTGVFPWTGNNKLYAFSLSRR